VPQQMHRAGGPSTSGGQSTEEMTATEEERLKHTPPPAPLDAAAHSFGDSGEPHAFPGCICVSHLSCISLQEPAFRKTVL